MEGWEGGSVRGVEGLGGRWRVLVERNSIL